MMVTARSSVWVPHAVLVTGLVLVLFPVYVAFVGSTLTASDILDAPMTLVPGSHLVENFTRALDSGTLRQQQRRGSGRPGAEQLLASQAVLALIRVAHLLLRKVSTALLPNEVE